MAQILVTKQVHTIKAVRNRVTAQVYSYNDCMQKLIQHYDAHTGSVTDIDFSYL